MTTRTRNSNANANANANVQPQVQVQKQEVQEQVQEQAQEETTDIIVSGKVLNVSDSLYDNRITIQLDKKFPSYDSEGNTVESDTFSIATFRAAQELSAIDAFTRTIKAYTLNNVTAQILSMILTGADIKIIREFKAQGELREGSEEEVYSINCYKTSIKSYKNTLDKLTQTLILQAAKDAVNVQKENNPFDII